MKRNYTKAESEVLLSLMKDENDMVRLVDPVTQQVLDRPEGGEDMGACFRLWKRCERCENCTSLKALQTKGRAYKIELSNQRKYLVMSRYLCIDQDLCVMETVNDVTDNLLLDSTQKDEVGKLIHYYNDLMVTDALTGLYNRRFLDEFFLPSLQCCHEKDLLVNLAMLDVNDFKQVNDLYGHQAGDALLKNIAGYWKPYFHSRERERERLVVRYGGDEILIIACGMSLELFQNEVKYRYSHMRKVCNINPSVQIPFSITFGIASNTEVNQPWQWNDLLSLADHRMYRRKANRKTAELNNNPIFMD